MFQELDVVRATRQLSPHIPAGTLGTVHMAHNQRTYLVEFVDSAGNTLDILDVLTEDIVIYRSEDSKV